MTRAAAASTAAATTIADKWTARRKRSRRSVFAGAGREAQQRFGGGPTYNFFDQGVGFGSPGYFGGYRSSFGGSGKWRACLAGGGFGGGGFGGGFGGGGFGGGFGGGGPGQEASAEISAGTTPTLRLSRVGSARLTGAAAISSFFIVFRCR
jgi:hypothetical protein